jgi:predicted nucleotidyltransferase
MSIYSSIFKALNDAQVQYVIVGGLATVLHGYARLTADVDLVVNLERPEAEKAVRAITSAGFAARLPVDPMLFADEETREAWIREKNMRVFSFYQPDNPLLVLDLFVREPMPFQEMLERAAHMDIGGVTVPVCAIEDLIRLKQEAGRPQDLLDIRYLNGILERDNET